MEDGPERGELAGWEKASARMLERHGRKPDPGRWTDDSWLLHVKGAGRRGHLRSNDEGSPECRVHPVAP